MQDPKWLVPYTVSQAQLLHRQETEAKMTSASEWRAPRRSPPASCIHSVWIPNCQVTRVLWHKLHDVVSSHGTLEGQPQFSLLTQRQRCYGVTLTCWLFSLFIEKICGAYGGTGREPLQPRPGLKLDRKRQS